MHKWKREEKIQGRGSVGKTAVMGILERKGKVSAKVIDDLTKETLHGEVKAKVEKGSSLFTDEWASYQGLAEDYMHETINHSVAEYVRGNVHTNSIENALSEDGERSSRRLWKEIKAPGYPGAEVTLRHFLQKWREAEKAEIQMQTVIKSSAPGRAPSIRKIKWLLFGKQEKPKEQWEQIFLQQLCRDLPEIETGQKLVREFHQLMINRQSEGFKRWLEKAPASGIGELVWFANGVEQNRAPVEKAFESEWSQGQTEGQVNRLKFLKRQMYGRANFDLLRARVVCGS